MKHRLMMILLGLGLPLVANATTYYVGANNCSDSNTPTQAKSSSTPWCTINRTDSSVVAGDTVRVLSGTYNVSTNVSCNGGSAAICTTKNGTSSARITYQSDVRGGAKLVISSNPDACWHATGNFTDYIGFDITENPSNGSCREGLWVQAGHVTVQQNKVHDLNRNSLIATCSNSGAGGILVSSQNTSPQVDTALVDSNLVDNIGGQAPGFAAHNCNFIHAFYLSMSNLTVTNNIALRAQSQGFSFGGHPGQIVTGSVVANNAAINNGFTGFYLNADTANLVYNNIVYQPTSGTEGFKSIYSAATTVYDHNLVYMPNGGTPYNTRSGDTVNGNISSNPLFVNYTGTASGDYHLQAGSPSIGNGRASGAPPTDFTGLTRSSPYDIGAYKFGGESASSAPNPPSGLTAMVQ